jgi:hypothetical protein
MLGHDLVFPNAAERLEQLLISTTKGGVQPNGQTDATVMDAWSRSFAACPNSAQCAYALLIEMEQMAAGDSQSSMKPNCVSYSTVVNAVSVIATL